MQVIDGFLSKQALQYIQALCMLGREPSEVFTDYKSELYIKCQAIFGGTLSNAMIYRIPSTTEPNPHKDSKKWSTVFYPCDSDGPLVLYDSNWKPARTIEVKENRMVSFASDSTIHAQRPPSKGVRYSVAFHWLVF